MSTPYLCKDKDLFLNTTIIFEKANSEEYKISEREKKKCQPKSGKDIVILADQPNGLLREKGCFTSGRRSFYFGKSEKEDTEHRHPLKVTESDEAMHQNRGRFFAP